MEPIESPNIMNRIGLVVKAWVAANCWCSAADSPVEGLTGSATAAGAVVARSTMAAVAPAASGVAIQAVQERTAPRRIGTSTKCDDSTASPKLVTDRSPKSCHPTSPVRPAVRVRMTGQCQRYSP